MKSSCQEDINEFIILNLMELMVSIFCSTNSECKNQNKPRFRNGILIGLMQFFFATTIFICKFLSSFMLDTSFYFHFCVKTQKSLLFFLIGVFSDKICRNEKKYVRTVGCSMQISENLPVNAKIKISLDSEMEF